MHQQDPDDNGSNDQKESGSQGSPDQGTPTTTPPGAPLTGSVEGDDLQPDAAQPGSDSNADPIPSTAPAPAGGDVDDAIPVPAEDDAPPATPASEPVSE